MLYINYASMKNFFEKKTIIKVPSIIHLTVLKTKDSNTKINASVSFGD